MLTVTLLSGLPALASCVRAEIPVLDDVKPTGVRTVMQTKLTDGGPQGQIRETVTGQYNAGRLERYSQSRWVGKQTADVSTRVTYDASGRIRTLTPVAQAPTLSARYEYDAQGRILNETNDLAGLATIQVRCEWAADASRVVQTASSVQNGKATPFSRRTYTLRKDGRPVSYRQERLGPSTALPGLLDATPSEVMYEYDERGVLRKETEYHLEGGARSLARVRTYNEHGWLSVDEMHGPQGVKRVVYTYVVDARGNWVKRHVNGVLDLTRDFLYER